MNNMQDWTGYRDALQARIGEFSDLNPDVIQAVQDAQGAAAKTGHLAPKVHSLIALAVAVTTRCDGCIVIHAQKALEAGATRDEIAEALSTAIALNAGAAVVYSSRVFDAIDALGK